MKYSDVVSRIKGSLTHTLTFVICVVILGILFTGTIKKHGPGRCSMVGAMVGTLGFLVGGFATNIWTIVTFIGIIAGKTR